VVDWRELIPRLRAGEWTCAQHGRVVPDETAPVVPICPHCGQMVRRVGFDRRGVIFFAEPSPAHCAGPDAHPLGPNQVLLGWMACTCAPASAGPGGHRTWRCTTCGDLQQWPPHQPPDGASEPRAAGAR
jgi:hypothetical protein